MKDKSKKPPKDAVAEWYDHACKAAAGDTDLIVTRVTSDGEWLTTAYAERGFSRTVQDNNGPESKAA